MTTFTGRMAFAVLCSQEIELESLLLALPVPMAQVVVVVPSREPVIDSVCERLSVRRVVVVGQRLDAEGVNAGAALAKEIGASILCVVRSHVSFRTQVVSEAATFLEQRPWMAIVAPSAVVIDGSLRGHTIMHRTSWHLGDMRFYRETLAPEDDREWYDADFCEFSCAFVRMSALDDVGVCDVAYESPVAAADLCLRLQDAGYGCAYLTLSQVEFTSRFDLLGPVTSRVSADLARFAEKHLRATVRYPGATGGNERIAALDFCLARYGLRGTSGPVLTVQPGVTPLATSDPLSMPSLAGVQLFTSSLPLLDADISEPDAEIPAGISIRPAIDADVFHAWGRRERVRDSHVFLAMVDGWETAALESVMRAWQRGRDAMPGARLILLGRGLLDAIPTPGDVRRKRDHVEIAQYRNEGLEVYEFVAKLNEQFHADLLRSVSTVLIIRSADIRPVEAVLQAAACGTAILLAAVDRVRHPDQDGTLAAQMLAAYRHRSGHAGPIGAEAADRIRDHTWRKRMRTIRQRSPLAVDVSTPTSRRARPANSNPSPIPPIAPAQPGSSSSTASNVRRLGLSLASFGTVWENAGFNAAGRLAVERTMRVLGRRLASRRSTQAMPSSRVGRAALGVRRPLLVGYINGKLGLGESLRGLAQSLIAIGSPFDVRPVTFGIEDRQSSPVFADRYDHVRPHAVNIIEVSANELPVVCQELGRSNLQHSYNIFRAWWELEQAPEVWRAALQDINEIWAPNTFIAQAFRAIFDGPITIVPPSVSVPVELEQTPIRDEPFTFLFSFDFHSSPHRKNPIGVVRAFQAAFADPALPVRLIVKSTSAPERHADLKEALLQAVADDGRIEIRDEHLSRPAMLDLLSHANCYVSLHRSEGFGLGMAEAMGLERPVIGTCYSGSADFLTESTGYPVGYQLRQLDPGEYVHSDGQRWAEPNHRDAVLAMRRVFSHRQEASAKARNGREFIMRHYSPSAVGRIAQQRLEEIAR